MTKKSVMVTIDEEIIRSAKEKGINVSESAEKGIFEKIGKMSVTFDEPTECDLCHVKGKRETVEDLEANGEHAEGKHFSKDTNLVWLYPDEKWLCNKCLKVKCNEVAEGKN